MGIVTEQSWVWKSYFLHHLQAPCQPSHRVQNSSKRTSQCLWEHGASPFKGQVSPAVRLVCEPRKENMPNTNNTIRACDNLPLHDSNIQSLPCVAMTECSWVCSHVPFPLARGRAGLWSCGVPARGMVLGILSRGHREVHAVNSTYQVRRVQGKEW